MTKRLIDLDEALYQLGRREARCISDSNGKILVSTESVLISTESIKDFLNNQKLISVPALVEAFWVQTTPYYVYECSHCGYILEAPHDNIKNFHYCSRCGAKMVEVDQ